MTDLECKIGSLKTLRMLAHTLGLSSDEKEWDRQLKELGVKD